MDRHQRAIALGFVVVIKSSGTLAAQAVQVESNASERLVAGCYDLPYLVLATGISIVDRPDLRLELEAEYQWLRVTSDQFRRTYQNFDLVAEEPLGRVHKWSHAFVTGVHLSTPLRQF